MYSSQSKSKRVLSIHNPKSGYRSQTTQQNRHKRKHLPLYPLGKKGLILPPHPVHNYHYHQCYYSPVTAHPPDQYRSRSPHLQPLNHQRSYRYRYPELPIGKERQQKDSRHSPVRLSRLPSRLLRTRLLHFHIQIDYPPAVDSHQRCQVSPRCLQY